MTAAADQATADAFANSWNHLPAGSVYTREQFEEWLAPITRTDVEGRDVLELGCGNGSLLVHLTGWEPARLVGVDLGDSVRTARANLAATGFARGEVVQADLTKYQGERPFDVVYCIGVIHHLQRPEDGFAAVLRATRAGGLFHCWVYAWEGNALVRWIVEPLRRIASRLPWWLTKHGIATPAVAPYFLYAKLLAALPEPLTARLPLGEYSRWIARRDFSFFRHVAFDQLVTPQTAYIRRSQLDEWLERHAAEIEPGSIYVICRNGNSWKFGGRKCANAAAEMP